MELDTPAMAVSYNALWRQSAFDLGILLKRLY